jgi:hypothetical protein
MIDEDDPCLVVKFVVVFSNREIYLQKSTIASLLIERLIVVDYEMKNVISPPTKRRQTPNPTVVDDRKKML